MGQATTTVLFNKAPHHELQEWLFENEGGDVSVKEINGRWMADGAGRMEFSGAIVLNGSPMYDEDGEYLEQRFDRVYPMRLRNQDGERE